MCSIDLTHVIVIDDTELSAKYDEGAMNLHRFCA